MLAAVARLASDALTVGEVAVILVRPADVQCGERNLQRDERVCAVVQTPHDPQHVAQQEQPEADLALAGLPRGDEPGGGDRDDHGGPLQKIEIVHEG